MAEENTTAVVEQYLSELAAVPGDTPADPIIRVLLSKSVNRLHILCTALLHRNYPRLTRPPLNLQSEEMLSAVVERMMKALRKVRPGNARQFFGLVNQHMRWELNDLARKLDAQSQAVELHESAIGLSPTPEANTSQSSSNVPRILEAIDSLPEEEREDILSGPGPGNDPARRRRGHGVSVRTVQRRLTRTLQLLAEKLRDLQPSSVQPDP